MFCNEALVGSSGHKPHERSKLFLQDYCFFYISKYLPTLIRQNRSQLLSLPQNIQQSLVSHSFNYMVDDKSDLETVLKYMASIFSDSSIDELFEMVHSRVSKCCNVDTQRIP